ncbi:longitudinals lacking protein, isoforms H/M/V-like isoform X1 [Centruroides vittatus]|uniref:longitudinals lacking protein, isoforms H/M/V-like isoform X1 n=1 Tax=Centruroides vittatus TaxID=120091 RepID=UPI0035103D81
MGTQQFYLKWNSHQSNMITVLDQLLSNEAFVDVTLACEGLSLKAHKIILSACSPFFRNLFLENPCKHPIVILKDVKYTELKAVVDFIYKGEISISHDQLSGLLKTAEVLNIKGLVEVADESRNSGSRRSKKDCTKQPLINVSQSILSSTEKSCQSVPLSKKKRSKLKRRSSSDSNSSDNEEIPSKLKEPDSPEIIEEILPESTNDSHKQLTMPSQSDYQSCEMNDDGSRDAHSSLQPSALQQNEYMNVEEPSLDYERNYVESSNLLEQIMVTEDKPIYPESTSQDQIESSATASAIPSTSGLTDNHSVHTGPASNESEILASCSTASEASTSNCLSEDVPDIKPIMTFDDPPGSPESNIIHKDSSMYIDTLGVSSLPGPSSFQTEREISESADQQNLLKMANSRILSQRDKEKYAWNGYLYIKDKINKEGSIQFWRCENKNKGCKARIWTSVSKGSLICEKKEHSCSSYGNADRVITRKVSKATKKLADTIMNNPSQIRTQIKIENVYSVAEGMLSNHKSLCRIFKE